MRNDPRGVSLIELLVVVAIVAALATVAVPGYRRQAQRAARTEARTALLGLAAAQERYYLQCHQYASTLDATLPSDCSLARLRYAVASERGDYTLAMVAADAAAWSATATRVAGSAQAGDATCRVFALDSSGVKSALDDAGVARSRECWGG